MKSNGRLLLAAEIRARKWDNTNHVKMPLAAYKLGKKENTQ